MTSRFAPLMLPLLVFAVGCSIGQGTGQVKSDVVCGVDGCTGGLFVHGCWGTPPTSGTTAQGAPYDLGSDLFFAANPYAADPNHPALQMRVQRGTDLTEVSDGLAILVDNTSQIRAAIQAAGSGAVPDAGASDAGASDAGASDAGASDAGASDAGPGTGSGVQAVMVSTPCNAGATGPSASFSVALPVGIHPPGSPTEPPQMALDSVVHMSLYLSRTCHIQNAVLYGISGTATFRAMFDDDASEANAADKLIDADFDVQFADIGDAPPGAYAGDVPAGLQSRVTGCFRFYYQEGQPAQPFP